MTQEHSGGQDEGGRYAMPIVLLATILTFSALYAPQPLLPVMVETFAISRESAALLTTIAFLPLSIAPLAYGYLLESVAPRRMLRIAVLLLAFSEFLFAAGTSYPALLALRLLQGMLIPAVLTALMTYIARVTPPPLIQRAMGIYIGATILGGFLGRACSGMVATAIDWRTSFVVLAASFLLCHHLLGRLPLETTAQLVKPTPRQILRVLGDPLCLRICLVAFFLFLAFAAIMNYLPFRLTEISDQASEFRIGLMYTGYAMGIVTALNAVRLQRLLGGETRAMTAGLLVFALALLALNTAAVPLLFLVMFLLCAAMFLVHATASGYLNRNAPENKGIVNGLYVSFYYAGGTVGSWLPGYIYRHGGWSAFLLALALVSGAAIAALPRRREWQTIDSVPSGR